jgi:hypothetical protein
MKTRTVLALFLMVATPSVSLVALEAPPAAAANCGNGQGSPLLLGCANNTATDNTVITGSSATTGFAVVETAGNSVGVYGVGDASGVEGFGSTGVFGDGGIYGLAGSSTTGIGVVGSTTAGDGVEGLTGGSGASGVYGDNTGGGKGVFGFSGTGNGVEGGSTSANGVQGESAADTASGVYGQNSGTGYGVAGRATGGIGALGDSANGIGVWANSQNATALKVSGRAQFSRSGVATVAGTPAAPKNSVRVSLPITAKSMMTATLQKYVAGVYVVAAVPNVSGGYFTIYLNKTVTTSVGPVAWMVTERP